MNRNSPVPLWTVLSIGVVLLGSVYVAAQRGAIQPQASVIVMRQTSVSPRASTSMTDASTTSPRSANSSTSGGAVAGAPPTRTISPSHVPTETPIATPIPSAIGKAAPNDWLTYRNTKYGYEIKYPLDWRVTAPGDGEARSATGTDAQISIVSGRPNAGVYFLLYILGSDDIGDYYRPARNLDQYLQLLTAGSSSSIHFVNEFTIDGRRAVRYEVPIFKDAPPSAPAIFLQNDNYVLEIMDYYVEETVFENILSSIQFIGRTQ